MSNFLDDFQGKAAASSIFVPESGVRLPDIPCKFVKLSNWNTANDSVQTVDAASASGSYLDVSKEVYYGFNGIIIAQLFPAQSTEMLPISNLNQVCLQARVGSGGRELWYAWWW